MVNRKSILCVLVALTFLLQAPSAYATRVYMQGGTIHYDATTWPVGLFGEAERMVLNTNVTVTNNGLGEALSNNSGIILDALYDEINITIPAGSYLKSGNYTMYVRAKSNVSGVVADLGLSVNAFGSFHAPTLNFTYYLLPFYVTPAQQTAQDDFQFQIRKNRDNKTAIIVDYFILSYPNPDDARVNPNQNITWYIGPLTQPDANLTAPTIMNVTLWNIDDVLANALVTVDGYGVGAINMTGVSNSTLYEVLLTAPGSIVNGTSSFIVDHYNVSITPVAQTVAVSRRATLTVTAVSTVDGYTSTSLTVTVSGVTMNPTGQTTIQNTPITLTYDNMTAFLESTYGITNATLVQGASVTWFSNVVNVIDDVSGYMFVLALIPLVFAGAWLILMLENGEFTMEGLLIIISMVIMVFTILVIWGAMTNGY